MVNEKWYNRWLRLQNVLVPGRIYIARCLWHLGDFYNIYLPAKYKRRPKKSYYLRAGPWHCAIWQIRRYLFH